MKINNILLYEPNNTEDFYPFSVLHPIWEIRIGAFKIFEKYQFLFPESQIIFTGRKDHLDSFYARFGYIEAGYSEGNILLLDSSLLPTKNFINEINGKISLNQNSSLIFSINGSPVGAFLTEDTAATFNLDFANLPAVNFANFPDLQRSEILNYSKLNYLFDAIYLNKESICEDAELMRLHKRLADVRDFPSAHLINSDDILVGKNVHIQPGSVIDATKGPIILDDNSEIMSQAVIIGPCYIGKNTIVKIGAKIYQDNSFGEWCKVGGEIENSIIQAYSNKQHEGFLGHSFICEWVNLGADTNTSDLKNTYSNIKISLDNRDIDTGKMFLGLLCGDHTKSGINTMFTTGTVAGICGILVREWFLPNFIPSFSWGGAKLSPIYKVAKAIETAKIVMQRRGKQLTPEEEKLMKTEYTNVISRSL